jgi:hypothetical protein
MSQPARELATAAVDANRGLHEHGERLDGSRSYSVTFPPDGLPPVRGFWSLTLYNEHHFFHPDELIRYSFGTKNKNLHRAGDGPLTPTSSATRPRTREPRANRLPAPAGHLAAGNGRRDGADERSE